MSRKLVRAYAALLDVLANGRSMAVACVALVREVAGVSQRTVFASAVAVPKVTNRGC